MAAPRLTRRLHPLSGRPTHGLGSHPALADARQQAALRQPVGVVGDDLVGRAEARHALLDGRDQLRLPVSPDLERRLEHLPLLEGSERGVARYQMASGPNGDMVQERRLPRLGDYREAFVAGNCTANEPSVHGPDSPVALARHRWFDLGTCNLVGDAAMEPVQTAPLDRRPLRRDAPQARLLGGDLGVVQPVAGRRSQDLLGVLGTGGVPGHPREVDLDHGQDGGRATRGAVPCPDRE